MKKNQLNSLMEKAGIIGNDANGNSEPTSRWEELQEVSSALGGTIAGAGIEAARTLSLCEKYPPNNLAYIRSYIEGYVKSLERKSEEFKAIKERHYNRTGIVDQKDIIEYFTIFHAYSELNDRVSQQAVADSIELTDFNLAALEVKKFMDSNDKIIDKTKKPLNLQEVFEKE